MNFSKLDLFMEDMPKRGYPKCELAIAKDGEVIYRKTVIAPDAPANADQRDIYWIFSATKVITCIAAMRLVEQGLISLDDPVSKYIPEFADLTVLQKDGDPKPAETVMTIEHLFTMTGGLSYNFNTPEIQEARDHEPSTIGIVRAMAKSPLSFEPGTHYLYSLCHDVLAAVVEIVSGMKFSEYLDTYIFRPLGIIDMGFHPNDAQKERFTEMYTYKNGTGKAIRRSTYNAYSFTNEYDSGGAGLFATVDEYIKIISVIANGGTTKDGYTILKPETIAMMGENHLCDDAINDFANSRLNGYGWGLCGRAHMDPVRSLSKAPVGEFGWDGAANAFALVDATNKIALYFGTQIMGCNYGYHTIHPTLRNLAYECIEEN